MLLIPPALTLMVLRPYWGAVVVVASIPIMPFLSLGDTSAAMILGIAATLCWLVNSVATRRPIALPPFAPALLAYIIIVAASLALAPPSYQNFRMLLTYISLFTLTLLLYNTVDSESLLLELLRIFSLSLTVLMTVGLFVYVFDRSLFLQWHPNSTRLDFGPSGKTDNNEVAIYAIALLPAQISLYKSGGTLAKMVTALSVPLWLISLVLIESRGAIVAGAATLVAYFLLVRTGGNARKPGIAALPAIAVLLVVVSAPLFSSDYMARFSHGSATRVILWKIALRIGRAHPLLGVGAGHFAQALTQTMPAGMLKRLLTHTVAKYALHFDSPHNMLLSVVVESGLLGISSFLAFVAICFASAVSAVRQASDSNDRDWLTGDLLLQLTAGMAGFFAGALFLTADRDRMLYVLVSAVAIASLLARKSAQPGVPSG